MPMSTIGERLRPRGMTKITVDIAVSVDGFAAGPNQSEALPMGEGLDGRLHRWMFDEPEAHAEELAHLTAGGAATANQYLAAGLVDELHLHVAPVLLGVGERLLVGVANTDLEPLAPPTGTDLVTHLSYRIVRAA